ncbi:MAG TPA: helix-turn-helix domain-containing protein, partial [Actinomycetales bacterium]|nr:helix-turn-helix domain-containing protein [Actinomycetales bacterium]
MPRIEAESLSEHRAQVRARLFDALSRLMHDRGFEAITMADIAAEAGVGRTAVYNHFADT